MFFQSVVVDLSRGSQDPYGQWQVKMGPFFPDICRSQIDDDPVMWPLKTTITQCGFNTLLALSDGMIRKTHDKKSDSLSYIGLNGDQDGFDPLQGATECFYEHGPSLPGIFMDPGNNSSATLYNVFLQGVPGS
jgi:hypothetical protein